MSTSGGVFGLAARNRGSRQDAIPIERYVEDMGLCVVVFYDRAYVRVMSHSLKLEAYGRECMSEL